MESFIQAWQLSCQNENLVKVVLSKPGGTDKTLLSVTGRLLELKGEKLFSCKYRYKTRDEVHHYSFEEGLRQMKDWLGVAFLQADLFTAAGNYHLKYSRKRVPHFSTTGVTHTAPITTAHNRQKHRLVEAARPYLHALGITNTDGEVLPTGQKKYKQIDKFIEIVDSLLDAVEWVFPMRVVDMGSGKGYLTFALYDYLTYVKGWDVQMTGIELRTELVDICNDLAKACQFKGLHFEAKDIRHFGATPVDMLIALHACDTATDEAIAAGIQNGAKVLVLSPCCHKQVRKSMASDKAWSHGILQERQAEIVTDAIRALLIESKGYQTKVFEFISTEHTGKNVMITGVQGKPNPNALAEVAAIKALYGVSRHHLEDLVG